MSRGSMSLAVGSSFFKKRRDCMLVLDLYVDQEIYVTGKEGIILKVVGIKSFNFAMKLGFTMNKDVEIIRQKLMEKIIKEEGKYTYPCIKNRSFKEI